MGRLSAANKPGDLPLAVIVWNLPEKGTTKMKCFTFYIEVLSLVVPHYL
jgi:hypothetical protein